MLGALRSVALTKPSFTVIICHYNDVAYLADCLPRVFRQARQPDQVILVDDGSDPAHRATIEAIIQPFTALETIWHDTNLGVVAAGNSGLARARGDYVAWWSVDDLISEDLIAEAETAALEHPGVGVIAPETVVSDETELGLIKAYDHRFGLSVPYLFVGGDDFARILRWRYVWLASSGTFLRRESLIQGLGWQAELDWFADWAALYDVAFRDGAALVGRPLSEFVRRDDSFGALARIDIPTSRVIVRAFLDQLRQLKNRKMRVALRRGPLALSYSLGRKLFFAAWNRPGDWDLLAAAGWAFMRHRFRRRGGVPDFTVEALLKTDEQRAR